MTKSNSTFSEKLLSVFLAVVLILGSVSPAMVYAVDDAVAEFDSVEYSSLAEALAAIDDSYKASKATPDKVAEIKLLKDTAHGFDVGQSDGSEAFNISIDLNGNTLTLKPAVGSQGTVSNGIRVLAYSKLALKDGTVVCSDVVEDNIKTGIANYGTLVLDNVTLKSGALTIYTINNRGELVLKGNTTVENGKVCQDDYGSKDNYVAITNDPYTAVYTSAKNAVISCESDNVEAGNIQLEQYGKGGKIELNISAGSFGEFTAPDDSGEVTIKGNITGGKFLSDVSEYCPDSVYTSGDKEQGFEVVKKAGQEGFGFENSYPLDQWIGETYTNKIINAAGTGETVYSIVKGQDVATIDSVTGELTFKKTGSVTVRAENPGDSNTLPAHAEYTVKGVKKYYNNPEFEDAKPSAIEFTENLVFNNQANSEEGNEGIIYKITGSTGKADIDGETGTLTISKAGEYTVTAIFPETELYYETTTSYTLSVICGEQDELKVKADATIKYSESEQYVITVSGGSGTGSVAYSIINGADVAEINPLTGAITTLKAGEVTIGIEKKADGNYNAANATVTITVEKADQKNFAFDNPSPDKLIWDDNATTYSNPVTGVSGSGKTVYEIISGDAAEINSETGKLTLIKAGTVVVQATNSGDDCYNSASASYTLTIEKAVQGFAFADGTLVEKKYGITSYVNKVINEVGSGELSFSVNEEKSDNISVEIDEKTGVLTIDDSAEKVGKIVVKVSKAANDRYEGYEAEYTLNISYLTVADDVKPTLSGKIINDSGWYVDTVKILAPEGFLISFSNSLDDSNEWKDSLEISQEGVNEVIVYLKNKDGCITDKSEIGDVKIDKAPPVDLKFNFESTFIERVLSTITFGIFKDKKVEATVEVTDIVSGIDTITYYTGAIANVAKLADAGNGKKIASFELKAEYKDTVRVVVSDVAGHTVEYKDDKIYVIDSICPTVDVSYEHSSIQNSVEDALYFAGDVTVHFTVTEENFELVEKAPKVTLNGDFALSLDWEFDEAASAWKASQTITNEGKHNIAVEFTDASGNQMESYNKTIYVDKTNPEVSVTHNPEDRTLYGNREITVKVTEENFLSSGVNVNVTAKDVTGAEVILSYNYAQYSKNPANWESKGNEHTLVLPVFKDNAAYTFDISCTDAAGNAAEGYETDSFVIDTTNPTAPVISYSEPLVEKLINLLSFGFYNEKVDVTITADDITSGVDYITWTYTKQDGSTEATKVEDVEYSADGKTASTSFSIDAQARGYISALVADKAGNTSNKEDENRINVVDSISPEINISYKPAGEGVKVEFTDESGKTVDSFAQADNAYYNGKATAEIVVNEANFFEGESTKNGYIHEIGIKVEKTTADGKTEIYEYLPADTDNLYDDEGIKNEYITWTNDGDKHSFTIKYDEDADYKLFVKYADYSENKAEITGTDGVKETEAYESKIVTVDTKAPIVKVEYTNDTVINTIDGIDYYDAVQGAVITVKEHNFRAADFDASVIAKDATGADIATNYNAYLKDADSWTRDGDTYTATIEFTADANYVFDYECYDLAGKKAEDYEAYSFTVDTVAPGTPVITYSTPVLEQIIETLSFGFYKAEAEVTISVDDATSGVDNITWVLTKQDGSTETTMVEDISYSDGFRTASITFEIPAQERGYISAYATDKVERESSCTDSGKIIVADTVSPEISINYSADNENTKVHYINVSNETVGSFSDAVAAVYDDSAVAEIVVNEANFFEGKSGKLGEVIHEMAIKLIKTDAEGNVTEYECLPAGAEKLFPEIANDIYINWDYEGDEHSFSINYEDEADYELHIEYKDYSENKANITADDTSEVVKVYKSKTVTVDRTAPVVKVEYTNKTVINTIDGIDYYNEAQGAVITVEEHNFRAADFDATVIATDVTGDDIAVQDYKAYLKDATNWTNDGNTYIATIDFPVDANYVFDYECYDLAGNKADEYEAYSFTVDTVAPEGLTISYSDPVTSTIIDNLKYGFYGEKVDVTVTVDDAVAGINHIEWTYTKQADSSSVNAASKTVNVATDITYSEDDKTATITFPISAQARGNISAVAYDRSENSSEEKIEDDIRVADTLSPVINVEYSSIAAGTTVQFIDASGEKVDTFEEATNAYFNDSVRATITINEANFFEGRATDKGIVHNVGIRLEKTDSNGNVTVYEYLPAGADKLYEGTQNAYFIWQTEGDKHSFFIDYEQEADYKLYVDYVDYSDNKSDITGNDGVKADGSYESKIVTVDKTAPVVKVEYTNNNVINTIDGRDYYNAAQGIEITVEEHNFRPSDFIADVTAKDVTFENDVDVPDYREYLQDMANWTKDGDTYSAKINFEVDANYSFDYSYKDLAEYNVEDYEEYLFTVDQTDPAVPVITYSQAVAEKVLEAITFGFYQADVDVTVNVDDATAGVDYIIWSYTKDDDSSDINDASKSEKVERQDIIYKNNGRTAEIKFTISPQARGSVTAWAFDKSANDSIKEDTNKIIVADTEDPKITVKYKATNSDTAVRYTDIENKNVDTFKDCTNAFFDGNVTAEITIEEANFFEGQAINDNLNVHDIGIKLTKTDADGNETVYEYLPEKSTQMYDGAIPQYIVWNSEADKHSFTVSYEDEADYVLEISYADNSSNEAEITEYDNLTEGEKVYKTYKSKTVTVDRTAPVVKVEYTNNTVINTIDGRDYYNAAQGAVITVEEHNFRPSEFEAEVTAKDVTFENDVDVPDYREYLQDMANWTKDGDTYSAKISFEIDANYSFDYSYKDLADNDAADYEKYLFTVDKTKVEEPVISYSDPVNSAVSTLLRAVTFGYYQDKVDVTVTADDLTSGVNEITWKYTKEKGSSETNIETLGDTVERKDITYSNNGKTAEIKFSVPAQARGNISVNLVDRSENPVEKTDSAYTIVTDTISPTRTVSYSPERVLDKATMLDVDSFAEGDDVVLYYKKSAKVIFTVNEANFYPEDVNIKINSISVTPSDWTQNGDVWTGSVSISGNGDYTVTMEYADRSTNEMVKYTSPKIAIDSAQPVIEVTYDNNDALNDNNFKADRTATIKIKEHNFRADDVKVDVTALDIQDNTVEIPDYKKYLADRSSWTSEGDVHTAKITYSADARYSFDISYDDIIGNSADDYKADRFVVDHTSPEDIGIEYSVPVIKKVVEKLTFGFYKPSVTVKLTTADITSGVDYITYTYTKQNKASDINKESETVTVTSENITYSESGKVAAYTFEIPAQARGHVSAVVFDKAGNSTSKSDKDIISITDNISPEISISYSAEDEDTAVQFVKASNATVSSFKKAAQAIYGGNVDVKIVVNEANFFEGVKSKDGIIHNLGIKLTRTDDEGNVTVTEYLPKDATGLYNADETKIAVWKTEGDTHTLNISYTADGDYVLEVEYSDLSTNKAAITANDSRRASKAYTSKTITVDKTAPVVNVTYGNNDVVNEIGGRKYFDAKQTATITVKEHNFRASDFVVDVIAENILGESIATSYAEKLAKESSWTKDGNTYTAVIKYGTDANYTFDYEFKDLAENKAADYAADLFTVDTKAPKKLKVSYSESILDKILGALSFGFYDAGMTVTITAEDETSPINAFAYSYIKSEGVSDVNAELINAIVKAASRKIVYDGKMATVEFKIPKSTLTATKQFNGTVSFTAIDRAENSADKKDDKRVIVDNIRPEATITYNTPVQTNGDISYYADDINVKLVIKEANFYKEDVKVTVTKDGAAYDAAVKWTDNNVDVHTGTFTLTEDGDYIIKVSYNDRSGNSMDEYTSGRLTIDTKVPSIHASDIENNTANKDEVYGFTLNVEDINIDESAINPVFTLVSKNEDGSYSVSEYSLGGRQVSKEGESYYYTVDNLPEDGYYTLTCSVTDMSGNSYERIVLDDGNEYDQVQFSINRNGSVFNVDKNTNEVVEQYFVSSVSGDVVIEEINVDPIESYKLILNGETLTEGEDFRTERTENSGEWCKISYIIGKDLFDAEGEYNIVVESVDKTNTTAFSDVKALNVAFIVDKTAPVITISGLESSGRYRVEEQTVTLIPTDDGGRLDSLKVIITDADGEPLKNEAGEDISVAFDMSGEEFLKYLEENDGKVSFVIPSGFEQNVQIICKDCATNDEGKANEYNEVFEKVTVSTSELVIYYANKPLFYGSIASVGLLACAAVYFGIFKKRRQK